MDAIKEEPDSEGETDESQVPQVNGQESTAEVNEATEPFAFAAVKVEVKVRARNS
jgi:hypothetical protein